MYALGQSNLNHDFNAYNAANQIWNGSAFVDESIADYLTYRIAATKNSDANDAAIDAPFSATAPAGTVRYIMRERGASLALSYTVWEGNEKLETDAATAATQATAAALDASRIPRAASPTTPGAPQAMHLENAAGDTLSSARNVFDGDAA